jgi:sigma-B regulation protein RsbQ
MAVDTIIERNNVSVTGKGSQVLLFAHGFGCDQRTWRSVIPAFQDDFRIVLFDYVGAGKSDLGSYNSKRYSTLEGYAEDVIEICTELDLKDVVFVGHSVSSMIGLLAVLKQPSFFSKIIFIGPSPRYLNDTDYYGGIDREDLESLLEVMDNNYLGWSRSLAPSIMGNADRPELGEALAESFCTTDPNIAKQFARVTFLSDNRDDLALLPIPSLTIQCKDDFLTSETVANYILARTPGNQVIMLDSSGHCPHLSDPDGVIDAIRSFIDP